ncbi:MAG: GNAT family N-acetyltransferase [bacterium]
MIKIPELTTDRLLLRAFTMEDAIVVKQLAGAKEIADTTMNIPHPYPDGAAEVWIGGHGRNFNDGKEVNWAICLKESGEVVGAISFILKFEHEKAEAGYWIGLPYWNKGYASEALGAVIKYGFDVLRLNKIYAHYFNRNPASGQVMFKNGMHEEGYLRQDIIKDGKYEDIIYCSILRSEFLG